MTFQDRTITIKEIQTESGLSLSWLRQLTRKGVLQGERKGREYLYKAGQVNKALGLKLQVREHVPVATLDDAW